MKAFNLDGMSHVQMIGIIKEIFKRVKTESFNDGFEAGYEQAKTDARMFQVNPSKPVLAKVETSQQKRDRIIEQAKADVDTLEGRLPPYQHVEYIVNKDKRTVVALIKDLYDNRGIIKRGIAKCSPNDCFNVHIGKVIALGRALRVKVPKEYLYTPQPTEVRVGDKIRLKLRSSRLNGNIETVTGFNYKGKPVTHESLGYIYEDQYEIIDDSRDGSEYIHDVN